MDSIDNTKVQCKNPDCHKTYNINKIQWHLSNNPECKSKYTSESLAELKKMCDSYRKNKLKENYDRKKRQKQMTLQVGGKLF